VGDVLSGAAFRNGWCDGDDGDAGDYDRAGPGRANPALGRGPPAGPGHARSVAARTLVAAWPFGGRSKLMNVGRQPVSCSPALSTCFSASFTELVIESASSLEALGMSLSGRTPPGSPPSQR
jgi:hypothetical protein